MFQVQVRNVSAGNDWQVVSQHENEIRIGFAFNTYVRGVGSICDVRVWDCIKKCVVPEKEHIAKPPANILC